MPLFTCMVVLFRAPMSAPCQPYVRGALPPFVVLYVMMYTTKTVIYGSAEMCSTINLHK